jgi:hypothetical protein
MDEDERVFPMDVVGTSSRPWKFQPQGYLVVILADTEEGQRAEAALIGSGFADRDIKRYTGEQILENHDAYMSRRGALSKAVGAVTDDVESRELYLAYARENRSAMWVRIPDQDNVAKALRVLADYESLHTRYYGDESKLDFHSS